MPSEALGILHSKSGANPWRENETETSTWQEH